MEKVKSFLELIFKKEQEAIFLKRQKGKIDEHNELVKNEINNQFQDAYDKSIDQVIPFNLIGEILSPSPDRFYDACVNKPYPGTRYLFKITEYTHLDYGTIWACYTSFPDSGGLSKRISDCFLVAEINNELKVISEMIVASDSRQWRHIAGDEHTTLRLHNLGKPIKTERYLEPAEDDWSMKEYTKDC